MTSHQLHILVGISAVIWALVTAMDSFIESPKLPEPVVDVRQEQNATVYTAHHGAFVEVFVDNRGDDGTLDTYTATDRSGQVLIEMHLDRIRAVEGKDALRLGFHPTPRFQEILLEHGQK